MAIDQRRLTPNQADKRRQLIAAARDVLAREGMAAATARGLVASGPLTKSAIHYYFADVDELVDEAMTSHVGAFVAALRERAALLEDPIERFWHTMEAYLQVFAEQPEAASLWFEYGASASRRGRNDAVRAMLAEVSTFLAELVQPLVADPAPRADALLRHLLGTVLTQRAAPRRFDELCDELALAAGLDRSPRYGARVVAR